MKSQSKPKQVRVISDVRRADNTPMKGMILTVREWMENGVVVQMPEGHSAVLADGSIEPYIPPPTSEGCHTIDRVVLPRGEGGVDYGTERVLLACLEAPHQGNRNRREVWWEKACRAWRSLLAGYVHEPGRLVLVSPSQTAGITLPHRKTLKKGGRLSRKLIREFAGDIDAHFGRAGVGELVAKVYTKYTVTVDPVEEGAP
jgi:hypothetical protein